MPATGRIEFPESAWRRVTVILVTYNSGETIGRCLRGLGAAPNLVVVDNASSDDTLAQIRTVRPDARLLVNPDNFGLGTAANQGFAAAQTDYVLFLNPDAETSDEVLAALVAALDEDPKIGLAVPLLENRHGRVRLSAMGPLEHNHHTFAEIPEGDFSTWFVTGSVMLARREAWRAAGGFDEAIFLYQDDVEFCLRMTRAGYALRVLTGVRARHSGGGSVRMDWRVRWLRDWHMTWGHLYIEDRHGTAAEARRQAWRLIVRHATKATFYFLVLRPQRMLGNLAKAHAAFAFLRGRPAWPGRSQTNI
jgi:GT2 family glycosyltransferase